MLRISLIGCGNIASIISRLCEETRIVAVYDKDTEKAKEFSKEIGSNSYTDFEEFISIPSDIVVEAASPMAVIQYGKMVLGSGKDIMIMSVGGLADEDFRRELIGMARDLGRKIYLPSGAIGGLDALSSAMVGALDEVLLETTKPPSSLGMETDKTEIIFEGTPKEAIERYPKNINVAVTLAVMAGNENVRVRIVADPSVDRNIHKIVIRGEVGELSFKFDNVPSSNKATSLLAGYSAVALLRRMSSPLRF